MGQKNKMRYSHTMEYYSSIKRNEVLFHAYIENISLVNKTSH